jgi:hypothetical protein
MTVVSVTNCLGYLPGALAEYLDEIESQDSGDGNGLDRTQRIEIFRSVGTRAKVFLFTPHDDDAVIGVGMWLLTAARHPLGCWSSPTGAMVTTLERHDRKRPQAESLHCYEQLGLSRRDSLAISDCGLQLYRGRRS